MTTISFVRAAAVALFGLAIAGPTTAFADIKDYEFQLVDPTVRKGERVFAVRLLNKTTGKAASTTMPTMRRQRLVLGLMTASLHTLI